MKFTHLTLILVAALIAAIALPAEAEIVYTPANISIPVGSSYNIDLNQDGVTDFTIRSSLLQDYCNDGDGFMWSLTVTSANGNAVVTSLGHIGSSWAAALLNSVPVNGGEGFVTGSSTMAALAWGFCGTGTLGEWLNLPDRYLGLKFRDANGGVHYGWAKLSTAAYVDGQGHLHNSTILSGFAYETIAGRQIFTGQRSDTR